jgi:serine/threonine-protein kinase
LEAAVRKAMAKHPGERFQSATEFADALDALPEGRASSESPTVQVHAPAPSASLEPTVSIRSKETVPDTRALVPPRDKRPMLAVGATGVLLVGLGAALLWPEEQETPPATSTPSPIAKNTPASKRQPVPAEKPAASAPPSSAPETGVPREDLPNIEQIERWVNEGKEWRRDQTLDALAKLRKQYPQSAYAPYLEGHVNFDNLRWVDGLASYGAAMRNNPAYRTDGKLIRNVIRCLVSDRFHTKCADFLVREVGSPAAPFLEEAARSDPYENVQSRAARVLTRVKEPR